MIYFLTLVLHSKKPFQRQYLKAQLANQQRILLLSRNQVEKKEEHHLH